MKIIVFYDLASEVTPHDFLQYPSGYTGQPYVMGLHRRDYLREHKKGLKAGGRDHGGRDHWEPSGSLTSTVYPQTPKDNSCSLPQAKLIYSLS